MTLDEAFEKYPDDKKMARKSKPNFTAHIEWLKGLKAWGNKESRELGYAIPQFMIEDSNADDWELVK